MSGMAKAAILLKTCISVGHFLVRLAAPIFLGQQVSLSALLYIRDCAWNNVHNSRLHYRQLIEGDGQRRNLQHLKLV